MKPILWACRAVAVPLAAFALLWWWSVSQPLWVQTMTVAWIPALLLLGGFGISAAVPRIALGVLASALVVQLVVPVSRFEQDTWGPYLALPLTAAVIGARLGARRRRSALIALLACTPIVAALANVPALGHPDPLGTYPSYGFANGVREGSTAPGDAATVLIWSLAWLVGAALLILAGWAAGSSLRSRRLQWAAEAEVREARRALSERDVQLRVGEQRDLIAQDVHDITAHSLSAIVAQADGAAAQSSDPTTRSALATIAESGRQALRELRGLLERLDQQTDGDTARSAEDVAELIEVARRAGAEVEHVVTGDPVPLTRAADLAVYRITQEAVTNAIRHGARGAGPMRVALDWRSDGLALTIASPVVPSEGPVDAGRGVVGMQERARLAGGWLTAGRDDESARWIVAAYLPRPAAVLA